LTARDAFLAAILVGFVGLGILDFIHGHPRTGFASTMLGLVNFLLLVKT